MAMVFVASASASAHLNRNNNICKKKEYLYHENRYNKMHTLLASGLP